jgi:hypothetical protein
MMAIDLFDAVRGSLRLGDNCIICTTSAGLASISSSSFDIQYKPGRENVVADTLSRSHDVTVAIGRQALDSQSTGNTIESGPVRSADQGVGTVNRPATVSEISEDVADDDLVRTVFGTIGTSIITLDQVAAATDADQYLLRQFVVSGWPAKGQLPPALKPFWAVQSELSKAVGGCVLVSGTRTIITSSLRRTVLFLANEGHPALCALNSVAGT